MRYLILIALLIPTLVFAEDGFMKCTALERASCRQVCNSDESRIESIRTKEGIVLNLTCGKDVVKSDDIICCIKEKSLSTK